MSDEADDIFNAEADRIFNEAAGSKAAPAKKKYKSGLLNAIAGGLSEGATLGHGAETGAGIQKYLSRMPKGIKDLLGADTRYDEYDMGDGTTAGDMSYRQARAGGEQEIEQFKKDHPYGFGGAELLGNVATGIAATAAAPGVAPLAMATGLGAVSGLGHSGADLVGGDIGDYAEAAKDTAFGAATGYGAGKVAQAGTRMIGNLRQGVKTLQSKAALKALADEASDAAAAAGEMGKPVQELSRTLEQSTMKGLGEVAGKPETAALKEALKSNPEVKEAMKKMLANKAQAAREFKAPVMRPVESAMSRYNASINNPAGDVAEVLRNAGSKAVEQSAVAQLGKGFVDVAKLPSVRSRLMSAIANGGEALGKWFGPLSQAAARGPQALAVADFLLSKKDGEWRVARQKLLGGEVDSNEGNPGSTGE